MPRVLMFQSTPWGPFVLWEEDGVYWYVPPRGHAHQGKCGGTVHGHDCLELMMDCWGDYILYVRGENNV